MNRTSTWHWSISGFVGIVPSPRRSYDHKQRCRPIQATIEPSKAAWESSNILDDLVVGPGSFYVMDRGYVDFRRLYMIALDLAFFVTRTKSRIQFNRLESRPVDSGTGVRSDQVVWLRNPASVRHYPDKLRRVHYVDPDTGKSLTFLTNNFALPAVVIALLYKSRWKVELFSNGLSNICGSNTFTAPATTR